MSNEKKVKIDKPEGHHCFACGTDNPIGLNLQFYRIGDSVYSDITLEKNHVGWENIAHGGIISALLDEIMSWTVLYFERSFVVTRKIEIKYIRPVLVGEPLTVKGKLQGPSNNSAIKAMGEIRNSQGKLLAKSTGEFVLLSDEQLSWVSEKAKAEMQSLFKGYREN